MCHARRLFAEQKQVDLMDKKLCYKDDTFMESKLGR